MVSSRLESIKIESPYFARRKLETPRSPTGVVGEMAGVFGNRASEFAPPSSEPHPDVIFSKRRGLVKRTPTKVPSSMRAPCDAGSAVASGLAASPDDPPFTDPPQKKNNFRLLLLARMLVLPLAVLVFGATFASKTAYQARQPLTCPDPPPSSNVAILPLTGNDGLVFPVLQEQQPYVCRAKGKKWCCAREFENPIAKDLCCELRRDQLAFALRYDDYAHKPTALATTAATTSDDSDGDRPVSDYFEMRKRREEASPAPCGDHQLCGEDIKVTENLIATCNLMTCPCW